MKRSNSIAKKQDRFGICVISCNCKIFTKDKIKQINRGCLVISYVERNEHPLQLSPLGHTQKLISLNDTDFDFVDPKIFKYLNAITDNEVRFEFYNNEKWREFVLNLKPEATVIVNVSEKVQVLAEFVELSEENLKIFITVQLMITNTLGTLSRYLKNKLKEKSHKSSFKNLRYSVPANMIRELNSTTNLNLLEGNLILNVPEKSTLSENYVGQNEHDKSSSAPSLLDTIVIEKDSSTSNLSDIIESEEQCTQDEFKKATISPFTSHESMQPKYNIVVTELKQMKQIEELLRAKYSTDNSSISHETDQICSSNVDEDTINQNMERWPNSNWRSNYRQEGNSSLEINQSQTAKETFDFFTKLTSKESNPGISSPDNFTPTFNVSETDSDEANEYENNNVKLAKEPPKKKHELIAKSQKQKLKAPTEYKSPITKESDNYSDGVSNINLNRFQISSNDVPELICRKISMNIQQTKMIPFQMPEMQTEEPISDEIFQDSRKQLNDLDLNLTNRNSITPEDRYSHITMISNCLICSENDKYCIKFQCRHTCCIKCLIKLNLKQNEFNEVCCPYHNDKYACNYILTYEEHNEIKETLWNNNVNENSSDDNNSDTTDYPVLTTTRSTSNLSDCFEFVGEEIQLDPSNETKNSYVLRNKLAQPNHRYVSKEFDQHTGQQLPAKYDKYDGSSSNSKVQGLINIYNEKFQDNCTLKRSKNVQKKTSPNAWE